MSNPTSNFGWQMPTPTDLVTDLPADFEVFGQAVDTSLADLKGGTTGQVLSKTTNADMDFTWVAPTAGDIEGVTAGVGISGGGTSGTVTITNDMATTITASGDIVVGTGSGTYDNLPIGTTNQVLTADTSVSPYKVKWATPSSGALTKIVSTTFSSVSTQDFLGCFTSTYRTYKIVFANIISSTNADMQLKLYKSGNTLVGDYSGGVMQISTAGTPTAAFSNSYLTVFSFGKINSSAGNQYAGGEITLFNAQELIGPGYGTLSGITSWQSGGGASFRIGYYGSLNRDGNDSITGFQLLPSTGTISGTATVYGLEK